MISSRLTELLCCPTCFRVDPDLCAHLCVDACKSSCPVAAIDETPEVDRSKCSSCGACVYACPRGAIDKVRLVHGPGEGVLLCPSCGASFSACGGYANLSPPQQSFDHHSKYTTEILDPEYGEMSRPLLGAGVRNRVLERFLAAGSPGQVLDLGCGNGKFSVWSRRDGRHVIGLDAANLFAADALRGVDLVQGDARLLPFASHTFGQVFSFDVMEHLTLEDVGKYLREARRVLKPGGTMLMYSNSREPSTLQFIVGAERRLANWLGRRGYIDVERDRARKSDHIKAITTFEELEDAVSAAGLELSSAIFWNGVFQSLVDNLIVKSVEALLTRRNGNRSRGAGSATEVRGDYRRKVSKGGAQYWVLRTLTELMYLDISLFGRLRSGSFFVLLKNPR